MLAPAINAWRARPLPRTGAQPVVVGDGDVGPIAVRTSVGSRLEGRVVLEGAPAQIAPPAFNLWTLPEDPDLATPAGRVRILEDWSFEVEGLTGSVRFGLRSAPPGWWLRAVEIDGLNVAEHAITLGAGAGTRRDVRVVLSNTAPVVAGRALDERGVAVSGATVLVFPVDAARWQGGRTTAGSCVRTRRAGSSSIRCRPASTG